jgi:predicted aspartyl protease
MTQKQSENNNNEFIDDSKITETRIKINKERTKSLIEILRYADEMEFIIGVYALKFIVESIDELDLNDSVIMKISKDIDEDYFKINVKLKLE